MSMKVIALLKEKFGGAILETHSQFGDDTAVVDPASWREIALFLRDDPRCAMNMFVDITAVEPRKREALFTHTWYKDRPDLDLYTNQDVMHRYRGIEAGCKFAEAFVQHSKNRQDLPVRAGRKD